VSSIPGERDRSRIVTQKQAPVGSFGVAPTARQQGSQGRARSALPLGSKRIEQRPEGPTESWDFSHILTLNRPYKLISVLDRQEFFCPMTLAITLLFTLNLYLKLQRA
jgi:hypothetical protein